MTSSAQHGKGDRIVGADFATRSPVIAQNGMIATSHPLASQIGIDILKKGGSAVDAAIAANAALGLMEPTGSGVGGDLFAIVWDPKTEKLYGLNSSGRSPMGMSLEDLRTRLDGASKIPQRGSVAVSIPGAVAGWFELHNKFGSIDMAEILAPSIAYAKEGFPMTQMIAEYLQLSQRDYEDSADIIEELDNYKSTYMPSGKMPKEGEVFRNPDLARTYEMIAEGGRDAFYKGEIADRIDTYMRRIGGPLRKADLEAHVSNWIEPASVNYRGYDVFELPPNGQGIAALQMLNILEEYDLASMGHNSAEYLHIQTEAKKLAFEDRARFYADPDYFDIPLEGLLSKEYAAERRKMISMEEVMTDVRWGDPAKHGDTIYLSAADASGMMVSLIQSNYRGMGSGLVADGLGFMFQNRGEMFSMIEDHPNVYAPGKRPFHTIIPAFVMKDGKPWMSFGVMGGPMQPQGHVQILNNMIDFGMNIQEAGDAARFQHNGSSEPTDERMTDGGVLTLESGVSPEVVDKLRALGHTVKVTRGGFGGYQAIMWDSVNGVYHAASEMRKDGMAIGY